MTDLVERLRDYHLEVHPDGNLPAEAADVIETLTREKSAAESYVRIVTDYLRKVYPSDQDGADSPFGAVGFMVRERERAEAAESALREALDVVRPFAEIGNNTSAQMIVFRDDYINQPFRLKHLDAARAFIEKHSS